MIQFTMWLYCVSSHVERQYLIFLIFYFFLSTLDVKGEKMLGKGVCLCVCV